MPVTGIKSEWESGSLIFTESSSGGAPLFQIGKFVSAAVGSGMIVNSSKTKAHAVYADDNSVALTAGAYKAALARLLILGTCAAGDISAFGHQGQLKVKGDMSLATGHLAGAYGYLELASGGNVNVAAGVKAMADLPSGATVTGILSALLIASNDLGGTKTGKCSMVHIPNPVSGTWDYFLDFGSAPGAIAADTSATPANATHKIKCRIGATDFYLIGFADF